VHYLHDLANATQRIKLDNIQAEQARLLEGQTGISLLILHIRRSPDCNAETHEVMLYFHEVNNAHMRGKTAIPRCAF